jgi:Tol biopolymer transport system component
VAASVALVCAAGAEPISLETRAISRAHPSLLSSTGSGASAIDGLQAVSGDGRYGVFRTWSQNLLLGFTVQSGDIVLFDRSDGTLRPITRDLQDPTIGADSAAFEPSISTDGSTIVYCSKATNLTPGENGEHLQVYATDRETGLTLLVSRGVHTLGMGAAGDSSPRTVSGDGRFILFQSDAQDLVDGYQGFGTHLFLFDAETYEATLVDRSHLLRVRPASEPVGYSAMSRDGRWIAFTSTASDLVSGYSPAEGLEQLYLFDRETKAIRLVSHAHGSSTSGGSGRSTSPRLSADGSLVVFTSLASNLLPTSPGESEQVYAASTAGGPLRLVSASHSSAEVGADLGANEPSVNADGSRIAFLSPATNLLPQTRQEPARQIYLFDFPRGSRTLVSHGWADIGTPGNANSHAAVVSDSGETVVFSSSAWNLILGFSTPGFGTSQLFAFDRSDGSNRLLTFRAGTTAQGCAGGASFSALSADGSAAFFSSESDDLAVPDENRYADVFHASTGATGRVLVSARHDLLPDSRTSNGTSGIRPLGILSEDGRFSLFSSYGTDILLEPLTPWRLRLFLYDAETDGVTLIGDDVMSRAADPSQRGPTDFAGEVAYRDLRTVASDASAIVFSDSAPPPFNSLQAFVFDRHAGGSTLMSHRFGDPSAPANDDSEAELISAGGRFAVFASAATDLVGQYAGSGRQLYLYDRSVGTSRLISHHHGIPTQGGSGDSWADGSSADGRWVAFWSEATDLVSGYQGPPGQAYLFDAATGSIRLISSVLDEPLRGSAGGGIPASISNDGRFVAFVSRGQDIVGSPYPLVDSQAFVWDREASTSVMASHSGGNPRASSNASVWQTRISRDGRYVDFGSYATDLLVGYQGHGHQVYRFNRLTGQTRLLSHSTSGASVGSKFGTGPFATSADGQRVAMFSASPDLVAPPIPGGDPHVFLYDAPTDEFTLVSRSIQNGPIPTPNGYVHVDISADGRAIAFDYMSDNLVERDWNFVWGGWDAFVARESPPWEIFRDGFASGDASRWSVVAGGG